MRKTNTEIPFIVIDMNNDPKNTWNLFCGYDQKHHRIVFFSHLKMFRLPGLEDNKRPVWITVERDGSIVESGNVHTTGEHGEQEQLNGFEGIQKELSGQKRLPAHLLLPNDYVFISEAAWKQINPIDYVATYRKRGVLAKEVFGKHIDDRKKIIKFFSEQPNCSRIELNFQMAQVVFENYPGKRYEEFF